MQDVVLLVGNPNAGKSTLFNRLARGHARVGNWHGVTVDALEKRVKLGKRAVTFVDLPGVYRAEGRSMEEKFSCAYIASHPQAAVIFVAECAFAPRVLTLLEDFTRGGRRCMLVLTKHRRFVREGGKLDRAALQSKLKIPVLFAEEDVKKAVQTLLDSPAFEVSVSDMGGTFSPARAELSPVDRFITHPFAGLFFFLALLLFAFYMTFGSSMPGDLMKGAVEALFTDVLGGLAESIASPVVRSFVADGLLKSLGGVLCFLPQIALLHLFLILLEESGLMSRLAFLTDGLFKQLGLSGRAVFSLVMGFGCTAAAVTTTRGLDDPRMQRRVILCLPYISCSAKLPVYLVLAASFFREPFFAAVILYMVGVFLAVIAALFLRGETAPLILELAPLQLPQPFFVAKSLLFQIKQFIIKVATVILAFFIATWLLSSFDVSFALVPVEQSMLAAICGKLSFLFAPVGMNDWRITYAALSGLIAKENVAGAISMFYGTFPYSAASAFSFAIFILACSPCVSAIAATAHEVGKERALLYAAAQTGSALLLCYLVYFCLTFGAFTLFALPVLAAALLLVHEKVHRKDDHHPQSIHRRHLRTGVDVPTRALKAERRKSERREGGGGLHIETVG